MDRGTTNPMGYLAENWPDANDDTPALIVNPQASPIDLLAWIYGELLSMEAAGNALTEMTPGNAAISLADFTAIFMHRIAPAARVLDVALCELIAQRRQREGLSDGL